MTIKSSVRKRGVPKIEIGGKRIKGMKTNKKRRTNTRRRKMKNSPLRI
jgi:hypothetical protein